MPETDKKGFFGKKKEKKDKKDEQIAELTDKLKRQLAEFENFRNRTDKEKSQMYAVGAKDVIEKILPVIDNFERGLKSIPEDQKGWSGGKRYGDDLQAADHRTFRSGCNPHRSGGPGI